MVPLHDFSPDGSSIRQFVKLLSATPTETLELITSVERGELEVQLRGLGEDGISERCFVEAALEELKVFIKANWYSGISTAIEPSKGCSLTRQPPMSTHLLLVIVVSST